MRYRKTTVRSTIQKLPVEQREKIDGWLRENLTYSQIVRRIYGAFGLQISPAAVGGYYQRHFLTSELKKVAAERGTEAAGVEITILFPEPGRVHVSVRPLEK